MTVASALIGGTIGYGLTLLTNAARKYPLGRQPWWHVTMTSLFMWIGHQYPKWEQDMLIELNDVRRLKGLPPFLPSNKWLGLELAQDSDEDSAAANLSSSSAGPV